MPRPTRPTTGPVLDRVPQGPGKPTGAPDKVPTTTRISPPRLPVGSPPPAGRDWAALDRRYQDRGNLWIWIDPALIRTWKRAAGRGRSYPQELIDLASQIGAMYSLALRQQEGYLRGFLAQLRVELTTPDHTTLARRRQRSELKPYRPSALELEAGVVIAIDSSGIRVTSLSSWRYAKHGGSPNRAWVKLHQSVSVASGGIMSLSVTDQHGPGSGDCSQGPGLVESAGEACAAAGGALSGVLADGAYDTQKMYRTTRKVTGKPNRLLCPPHITATYGLDPDRDVTLARIGRIGIKRWRETTGYGQRSGQGEGGFSVHKKIFTEGVRARSVSGARAEIIARANLYNQWRAREVALGT